MEPAANMQTAQGLLQIAEVGLGGYRMSIAGNFIVEFEAYGVDITGAIPSDDFPQYVLLEIDKGGGSCPYLFRLLDLTPGRKPFLTGEFGNCSAWPALKIEGKNISVVFSSSHDSNAEFVLYDSGRRRMRTQ